jgi:hypothetical protein
MRKSDMTKFTDKYGRTWNHLPGHNPDRMLKIKPDLMLLAYQFHHKIRNQDASSTMSHSGGWPAANPDCYLLKGATEWHAGIRLSDEQSDYISPYFDQRVIAFMIENHRSNSPAEAAAIWELRDEPICRGE